MRVSACVIGLFAAAASSAPATGVSAAGGVLGLTRLVSTHFGLLSITAPAPPGSLPPPRLLATTSAGARFEEIGLRLPARHRDRRRLLLGPEARRS